LHKPNEEDGIARREKAEMKRKLTQGYKEHVAKGGTYYVEASRGWWESGEEGAFPGNVKSTLTKPWRNFKGSVLCKAAIKHERFCLWDVIRSFVIVVPAGISGCFVYL